MCASLENKETKLLMAGDFTHNISHEVQTQVQRLLKNASVIFEGLRRKRREDFHSYVMIFTSFIFINDRCLWSCGFNPQKLDLKIFQFCKIRMHFPVVILALILAVSSLKVSHHQGWDQYLVNLVKYSKDRTGQPHMDRGAIISLDGGASLTSPNAPNSLKLTPAQAQEIAQVMKSGDFSSFQAKGIVVEGVKYQLLRQDGKVAFAKKTGKGYLTLSRSKSAVVIGHTAEGKQQGNTNIAVGAIANDLESVDL